jgi:hypothetical protein
VSIHLTHALEATDDQKLTLHWIRLSVRIFRRAKTKSGERFLYPVNLLDQAILAVAIVTEVTYRIIVIPIEAAAYAAMCM